MSMTKTMDSVTTVDESLSAETLDKISTSITDDVYSDVTTTSSATATAAPVTIPADEEDTSFTVTEGTSTEPLTMKTDVTESVQNLGLILMIALSALTALWVAILTFASADFGYTAVGWSAAVTSFVLAGTTAGIGWVMWLRNHTPWAWVVVAASLPVAWTGFTVIQAFN